MRSHSICLVMFRINGRFGLSLEPKDTSPFIRGIKAVAPVSEITLILIAEAAVYIYFRKYVFHPCPLQSQFTSNEAALLSLTSSAGFCLHRGCWAGQSHECFSAALSHWVFFSPPGGFLCSVDTDCSLLLEVFFLFCLL